MWAEEEVDRKLPLLSLSLSPPRSRSLRSPDPNDVRSRGGKKKTTEEGEGGGERLSKYLTWSSFLLPPPPTLFFLFPSLCRVLLLLLLFLLLYFLLLLFETVEKETWSLSFSKEGEKKSTFSFFLFPLRQQQSLMDSLNPSLLNSSVGIYAILAKTFFPSFPLKLSKCKECQGSHGISTVQWAERAWAISATDQAEGVQGKKKSYCRRPPFPLPEMGSGDAHNKQQFLLSFFLFSSTATTPSIIHGCLFFLLLLLLLLLLLCLRRKH